MRECRKCSTPTGSTAASPNANPGRQRSRLHPMAHRHDLRGTGRGDPDRSRQRIGARPEHPSPERPARPRDRHRIAQARETALQPGPHRRRAARPKKRPADHGRIRIIHQERNPHHHRPHPARRLRRGHPQRHQRTHRSSRATTCAKAPNSDTPSPPTAPKASPSTRPTVRPRKDSVANCSTWA